MIIRLIVVVAACAALVGCGDLLKGKSLAEPQVATFHARLNQRQFDDIYTEAGDQFRKAATKEKVVQLFSAIDRKLGPAKSWTTKTWTTHTRNFVTTAVLVVDTVFEKGAGTETFTFRISGDSAIMIGYHINSLDMLTQ